jgi:hypothetical protein
MTPGSANGSSMPWPHARLIPTAGIRNDLERERRASSCLLAVMHGVPEFGHALLHELGAPKSSVIETYAEVRCKGSTGKTVIPDGAIVCRRAGKSWTCLVEVKTANNELKPDQVEAYLDVAREEGFDGVLTISNQITATPAESPVALDGRKLKRVGLWHLSWWRILTEAVVQSRHRGISDPNQAWILRELIHYLSTEASGASGFQDMGDQWVTVRNGVVAGTLRQNDSAAKAVADRWEQFTQYLCLSLSQELGRTVTAPRPRKQSAADRLNELVRDLVQDGELDSTLRVPDAIGDMEVVADLRGRQTSVSVSVDAPGEGRAKSRITWLLRQLDDTLDDLKVEAKYPNVRETIPASLAEVREDPTRLLYPAEPKRGARSFVLTYTRPMGKKRGRDEGSFVRETSSQAVVFYRDLVQNLKPWQARAPRLPKAAPPAEAAAESDGQAQQHEQVITPPWSPDPLGPVDDASVPAAHDLSDSSDGWS